MEIVTAECRTVVSEEKQAYFGRVLNQAIELAQIKNRATHSFIVVAESEMGKTVDEIMAEVPGAGPYRGRPNAVTLPRETNNEPEYFIVVKEDCLDYGVDALLPIMLEELLHVQFFMMVHEKRGYIHRNAKDFNERLVVVSERTLGEYVVHKWLSQLFLPKEIETDRLKALIMKGNKGISESFVAMLKGVGVTKSQTYWEILASWLHPMFYHLAVYCGSLKTGSGCECKLIESPAYSGFLHIFWVKMRMAMDRCMETGFPNLDSTVEAISAHMLDYLRQFGIIVSNDQLEYHVR